MAVSLPRWTFATLSFVYGYDSAEDREEIMYDNSMGTRVGCVKVRCIYMVEKADDRRSARTAPTTDPIIVDDISDDIFTIQPQRNEGHNAMGSGNGVVEASVVEAHNTTIYYLLYNIIFRLRPLAARSRRDQKVWC